MSPTLDRRRPSLARWLPVLVLAVAAILRAATLCVWSDRLSDDRDDYLTVARQYLAHGFWGRFEGYPNSFRPPLYPLVLAAVLESGGNLIAIGLLQLALGTATVGLTFFVGKRLGSTRLALVAAALVAVDPLLIEYTAFPMTETLVTFLVVLLIAATTTPQRPASETTLLNSAAHLPLRIAGKGALVGAIFGACALCRPTIWPAAGLTALWLAWRGWGNRQRRAASFLGGVSAAVATALVVFPWALRNERLLGTPVITTTHGGYTLLLGNNAEFFHHVAARPWTDDWTQNEPDRFQQPWLEGVIRKMEAEIGVGADEIAKDRWMYRQAWQAIAAEPGLFLRACGLRFLRFWNVLPLPPARSSIPPFVLWGLGAGYSVELVLFLIGIGCLVCRGEGGRWLPLLIVILNFTGVQLFYWTNTRMRAPLVPLIALLAARGLVVCLNRRNPKSEPSARD